MTTMIPNTPAARSRAGAAGKSREIWLALFLVLLLPAIGRCSISIMPMETQVKVAVPGSRVTDDIEVFNQGDAVEHVSASIMDWTMSATGEKQFLEPGTQLRSCASWIQLNPVEFLLPPRQSMRVRYSIATPANLSQEHWAMIFFTARPLPAKGEAKMGLTISTRIGCKLFVVPAAPLTPQGKITAMDIFNKDILNSAPPSTPAPSTPAPPQLAPKITVVFENSGAASIRLKGTVEARGEDGRLVAKGVLLPSDAQVLSGMARVLTAQFDNPLPPGAYRIKAVIDYGGKQLAGGELKTQIASAAPVMAAPPAEEAAPVAAAR